MRSKKLWMVLSIIFSTLLVILFVVTGVAGNYSTVINSALGLEQYKTVDEGSDGEDTEYFKAEYTDEAGILAYGQEVCEELEAEGMVLLKNEDSALPLTQDAPAVSLFGMGSVSMNCSVQGMRSSETYSVDFKEALTDAGFAVNGTLWSFYEDCASQGYGGTKKLVESTNLQTYFINEVPWSLYTSAVTSSFSDFSDAAIVVLTRDSTEGSDVNAEGSDGDDGNYLALSDEETALLKQVTILKEQGVFGEVIVLLNSANQLELAFLEDEEIDVDACLWIGNLGQTGIHAVAKALKGEVNPSGRLCDTYVYDNFSSPAMASWILNGNRVFSSSWDDSSLNESQSYYGVYVENVYVGYRYYETRYYDTVTGAENVGSYSYADTVAYPFGAGESYTAFAYSSFSVTEEEDSFTASVTVTNTGDVVGKETVQIYMQKPYTDYSVKYGIEVPAVELVGFGKTQEIAPGESETLEIEIEKSEMTVYDTYGAGTYIADAGSYFIAAGKDAHDAVNNILSAQGYSVDDGMDAAGDSSFVWECELSEQDFTSYAVSAETGNGITNQLAAIDMNRYVGGGSNYVTYVSRNDWENTWPQKAVTLTLTSTMKEDLENITEDDVAETDEALPEYGQESGLTLVQLRGLDYDDETWETLLDTMTFSEQNVLLTQCYGITPAVSSISKPQTSDMDGPTYCKETDKANKCSLPCEGIWASTFNRELIYKAGKALAYCALTAGEGMYAPGVNIHRTPYGGRAHEYFSEDPYLAGISAQYEIIGMQEEGVISYVKHFVLNDEEANRNGICIWLNEQSAREIYLEPWKYAVSENRGGAHAVMSSFNRAGCRWTSAIYELVTSVLRDEFGFTGFVITDMASANGTVYMTCLDGMTAGTDCWLSSDSATHNFEKYQSNATIANLMRESTHRILYNICNYSAAMNGYSSSTKTVYVYLWWQIALTAAEIVSAVLTAGSLVCLAFAWNANRKRMR